MTVLITGSNGFVGRNLTEVLSEEHKIIQWNAREDKHLPECDAVIHLAGLAHDTKNSTDPERYFEVNTKLTKRIYDRFLESGAKKFIFFSTIKAMDNDTPYAKSKKQAEDYILNTDLTDCTDKRVFILRPCLIHGKGNKGNLNLLVKWVKKGLPWPLAAFENKRSFASMSNVNFVVVQIMKKDVPSGVYDICDDDSVSTNELVKMIGDCMGMKTKMLRIPKSLMIVLARLGDCLHLPLNTERLGKLTNDYIIDNRKIKTALGIDSLPVDTRDGLEFSIKSIMNRVE